jgi:hypothetical protein
MVVFPLFYNIIVDKYTHFPSNTTIHLLNKATCFGPPKDHHQTVTKTPFEKSKYAYKYRLPLFLWDLTNYEKLVNISLTEIIVGSYLWQNHVF